MYSYCELELSRVRAFQRMFCSSLVFLDGGTAKKSHMVGGETAGMSVRKMAQDGPTSVAIHEQSRLSSLLELCP